MRYAIHTRRAAPLPGARLRRAPTTHLECAPRATFFLLILPPIMRVLQHPPCCVVSRCAGLISPTCAGMLPAVRRIRAVCGLAAAAQCRRERAGSKRPGDAPRAPPAARTPPRRARAGSSWCCCTATGQMPIHLAAADGHLATTQKLMRHGASPNCSANDGTASAVPPPPDLPPLACPPERAPGRVLAA